MQFRLLSFNALLKHKAIQIFSVLFDKLRIFHVKKSRDALRLKVIANFFDSTYWLRRYPSFKSHNSLIHVYLKKKECYKFDPHPLFDGEYYSSQLKKSLNAKQTLVEHYVYQGMAGGLNTSPLFSTKLYFDNNPDIKIAGVNPLLHLIQYGINEGRLPLPLDVPDLETRVNLILNKDKLNPYGLAYFAICMAKKGQHQKSADTLGFAKTQLPAAFYLKVKILCLILAIRIEDAEIAYSSFNCLPGVLPNKNGFTDFLEWGGRVAEENNEIETAIQLYNLAFEKRTESNLIPYRIALLQMKLGNIEKCKYFMSKIGNDTDTNNLLLANIISVKDHCHSQGLQYTEIYPKRPINYVQLKFVAPMPKLTSQLGSLTAPSFYLATIEDCCAFTGCNLLLHENKLIYDKAVIDKHSNACLGDTVKGQEVIYSRHQDIALLTLQRLQPTEFNCGLMMFGTSNANYGHWFLEYLPRMMAYESNYCNENFPIIINENMPSSHKEILQLLNVRKRQVIQLKADTVLYFKKLIVAPVPAYFPLDIAKGPKYDAIWPKDIFMELKQSIINSMDDENVQRIKHGRRIFISRKNFNTRNLLNEAEIESYLARYKFETIFPEKLTVRKQIEIFRSASIVIGSCSSALTNAIFCDQGARVVGLIHDSLDFNFNGYTSLIEAGGCEILFVRGVSVENQNHVHSFQKDYTVSLEKLKIALDWAMCHNII